MTTEARAQHTQGPLRAEPTFIGGGNEWTVVDPEPGFVIGIAVANIEPGVVAPAEANARLWAAAPDMLSTLEGMAAGLSKPGGLHVYKAGIHSSRCEACTLLHIVDATIAKATGVQS